MKKKLFFIASAVTLIILIFCFLFPRFFYLWEAKWIDQYFRLRGPKAPNSPIVLAAIDEKSLNRLGRWPWPRSVIAQLVSQLSRAGAKAVGFDITFSETSAEDGLLARSFQQSGDKSILGFFFYPSPEEMAEAGMSPGESKTNEQNIFPSRLSLSSKQLESSGRKVFGVQANVPAIAEAAGPSHQGFFNVFPDADGVIRTIPLVLYYRQNAYPSLSLRMAERVTGFSSVPLYAPDGRLKGLSLKEKRMPLQSNGEFRINYRGGPKTFPHISIADILSGDIPDRALADKIVLIGATAIGIYDMRLNPFSANVPGLEVQANVLDNLLTGDFLVWDSSSDWASLALFLFVGLFLGLGLPRFRALPSTALFLAVFGGLLIGGYLFFNKGWVLPVVKPVLNGCFVFASITIVRFFTEEKERRKIRKTFQHYLSPDVIKEALEHPERLKLGGERKILTVLFSDIRDFTPKSEKLPPERLVQLLNDYFTAMTEVVFEHGGTLDKFMGDAIMAIYGAPLPQADHARRASLTALGMTKALERHKKKWCEKYGLDDFKIGIGIHTGEMAVGNMGSAKRFNYTVIGDAVNLASRLETLTKEYRVPIIVSEDHYRLVKDFVIAKELGRVKVKGKEQETVIYELAGAR